MYAFLQRCSTFLEFESIFLIENRETAIETNSQTNPRRILHVLLCVRAIDRNWKCAVACPQTGAFCMLPHISNLAATLLHGLGLVLLAAGAAQGLIFDHPRPGSPKRCLGDKVFSFAQLIIMFGTEDGGGRGRGPSTDQTCPSCCPPHRPPWERGS